MGNISKGGIFKFFKLPLILFVAVLICSLIVLNPLQNASARGPQSDEPTEEELLEERKKGITIQPKKHVNLKEVLPCHVWSTFLFFIASFAIPVLTDLFIRSFNFSSVVDTAIVIFSVVFGIVLGFYIAKLAATWVASGPIGVTLVVAGEKLFTFFGGIQGLVGCAPRVTVDTTFSSPITDVDAGADGVMSREIERVLTGNPLYLDDAFPTIRVDHCETRMFMDKNTLRDEGRFEDFNVGLGHLYPPVFGLVLDPGIKWESDVAKVATKISNLHRTFTFEHGTYLIPFSVYNSQSDDRPEVRNLVMIKLVVKEPVKPHVEPGDPRTLEAVFPGGALVPVSFEDLLIEEATFKDDCTATDEIIKTTNLNSFITSGLLPLGIHDVTISALDRSGNVSEPVTVEVTVKDTLPPDILPLEDVGVEIPRADNSILGSKLLNDGILVEPATFDFVTLNPTITCKAKIGGSDILCENASFPTGITDVTWEVKDFFDNVGDVTQKVNVKKVGDNTRPKAFDLPLSGNFIVAKNTKTEITISGFDDDFDQLRFILSELLNFGGFVGQDEAIFQTRLALIGKISELSSFQIEGDLKTTHKFITIADPRNQRIVVFNESTGKILRNIDLSKVDNLSGGIIDITPNVNTGKLGITSSTGFVADWNAKRIYQYTITSPGDIFKIKKIIDISGLGLVDPQDVLERNDLYILDNLNANTWKIIKLDPLDGSFITTNTLISSLGAPSAITNCAGTNLCPGVDTQFLVAEWNEGHVQNISLNTSTDPMDINFQKRWHLEKLLDRPPGGFAPLEKPRGIFFDSTLQDAQEDVFVADTEILDLLQGTLSLSSSGFVKTTDVDVGARFVDILGMESDNEGNLYVLDREQFFKFNLVGNLLEVSTGLSIGGGTGIRIFDFSTDADGNIFVLTNTAASGSIKRGLIKLNSNFGSGGFATNDCFDVSEGENNFNRIEVVKAAGGTRLYTTLPTVGLQEWVGKCPSSATLVRDGAFGAIDVDSDPSANFIFVLTNKNEVHKLKLNGDEVLKFGGTGTGDGKFQNAQKILVNALGNVYVAEPKISGSPPKIQKFSGTGEFLGFAVPKGTAGEIESFLEQGEFTDIVDIAAFGNTIFVAEGPPLHRIHFFDGSPFKILNKTAASASFTSLSIGTAQFKFITDDLFQHSTEATVTLTVVNDIKKPMIELVKSPETNLIINSLKQVSGDFVSNENVRQQIVESKAEHSFMVSQIMERYQQVYKDNTGKSFPQELKTLLKQRADQVVKMNGASDQLDIDWAPTNSIIYPILKVSNEIRSDFFNKINPFNTMFGSWYGNNHLNTVSSLTFVGSSEPCLPPIAIEAKPGGVKKDDPTIQTLLDLVIATDDIDKKPSLTNNIPDTLSLGINEITFTAIDASLNEETCIWTITVRDTKAPEITPPPDVEKDVEDVKTLVTTGEIGTPIVNDVDPSPLITNDAPVLFPVGVTNIEWTAIDATGNSATAIQKVIIVDNDPPEIENIPKDIEIEAVNGFNNIVVYKLPTATDVGGLSQDIQCDPVSGSGFPIGLTSVICTAVDNAHLISFDSFNVVVIPSDDDEDGVINLLDDQQDVLSDLFSDVGLGGLTTGIILERGDQNLKVIDAAQADKGIIVKAKPASFGINEDFDCKDTKTGEIFRGPFVKGLFGDCFDEDGNIQDGKMETTDEDPVNDIDDDGDGFVDEDPGVKIGPEAAQIKACEDLVSVSLTDGDEVGITCGSVIIKSLSGSFEVEFKINEVTTASTTVKEGDILDFDSDELTITVSPESSGTNIIQVGDKVIKLGPGGTVKITGPNPDGTFNLSGTVMVSDDVESFSFDPENNVNEIILESANYELSTIIIPEEIKEPKINYKNVVTTNADGLPQVFVNPQLVVDSESSGVPFNVFIPAESLLVGPPEWDGVFNLPTVDLSNSVEPLLAPEKPGLRSIATSVIEIGFNEIPLFISIPVQLTFEGRAIEGIFNERVAYTSGGITTEITDICKGNTLEDNLGLPDNGDCKISEGENLFVWTKHLTKFSTFISAGTGGGGDETPPDFKSVSVFGARTIQEDGTLGFGGVLKQDIELTNYMPTVLVQTGTDVSIRILIYENSGKQGIKHITMYTNTAGPQSSVDNSDTFLRYDSGKITLKDPNGIFSNGNISFVERGDDVEAVFEFTAERTMPLSDIIIRVWDNSRNAKEAKFVDAILIIEKSEQTIEFGGKIIDLQPDKPLIDPEPGAEFVPETPRQSEVETVPEMDPEPLMSLDVLSGWAGYSKESISDSEFLNHIGIDGEKIPGWFKNSKVGKWVLDEKISQQVFVEALKYLVKNV